MRRRLIAMVTKLTDGGLRSPDAARRLGIRGRDVYRMLFDGELDGGPGRDGMVYFDEASIDAYLDRHGYGVIAAASTARDETGKRPRVRDGTATARNPSSEVLPGTERDGPGPATSGS